jgi:hypothetical protein
MIVAVPNAGNSLTNREYWWPSKKLEHNVIFNITDNSALTAKTLSYSTLPCTFQPYSKIVCSEIIKNIPKFFSSKKCNWKGYGFDLRVHQDNSYECPSCRKKIF